ncbi:MAG: hypothetical protein IPH57_02630 [Saprospiraceae bacterium]|nr:hypothetical protein [Saprospiraceae bacterium]
MENYSVYFPDLISGITTIILIICILIAIFRYKIWETGLYISTAFKYIVASAFISGIYLVLIFMADMLAADESVSMRFAVLFISILVFVFLRNKLQMLLDKYYYRKAYNAEVVISEFESRTSGFFDLDILFKKIGIELDRIFHFSSFALFYKQGENNYKQMALIGKGNNLDDKSFVPDAEFHFKS